MRTMNLGLCRQCRKCCSHAASMMLAPQCINYWRLRHIAPNISCTRTNGRLAIRRYAGSETHSGAKATNDERISAIDTLLGSGTSLDAAEQDTRIVKAGPKAKPPKNVLLELSMWKNGRAFLPVSSSRSAHEEEDAPKVCGQSLLPLLCMQHWVSTLPLHAPHMQPCMQAHDATSCCCHASIMPTATRIPHLQVSQICTDLQPAVACAS